MNLGQIKLKLSQYKSLNPKSGDQDQFQIFLEGKTESDNYCFLVTDFEVKILMKPLNKLRGFYDLHGN